MIVMSEEVDMNVKNEEDVGVKVEHVDCFDAFNTFQLFTNRDEVLHWARSVAHDIGFVAVIMRSDTNTGVRGRASFLLIACERSGEYWSKKNDLIRTCTDSRKSGCPFKLHAKSVLGGEGWMVKLICGVHNHEMTNSLVGHPYADIVVVDMTKSMVKPRNILLTLKEYNANSYTTIKQIYNARHAYCSSIRGSNTKMKQLMMLLDRDQYIHLHRMKDDNVVLKLTNSYNLVFLINNTYKTNKYKLSLLDIVGVTPRGMTFSAAFAYLERECLNNNVKAKCKTLVAQKNAWDYVMEAWGSLVDVPCESYFDEYLKNFEMTCSP
ncbi:hypothetical protein HKD37_04G010931 [Glycine soja]